MSKYQVTVESLVFIEAESADEAIRDVNTVIESQCIENSKAVSATCVVYERREQGGNG